VQDSHTARALFEKLLCGPLLSNRTVVLVTHHTELVLPATAYLIRMLNGRIDAQGTPEDLRTRGVLKEITHEGKVHVTTGQEALQQKSGEDRDLETEVSKDNVAVEKDKKSVKKHAGDEYHEEGSIKWSTYNTYLKAR
jgi:ABC-type multidrug transport system ATPase subunit